MRFKAKLLATGAKIALGTKKHLPAIMIAAGVVGSIVATVEAVKGTLKAEEMILEPAKKEFEIIEKAKENKAYTEKGYKTDRNAVYIRSAGRFVKTYWKAILAWAVSIGLIIGAHTIQANRLSSALNLAAGATAALSAMTDNTRQTFGDEVAQALRTGRGIPEAVENCDFDKVKDCTSKKIQYHSDSLRSYADKEVDIPTNYKMTTDDMEHMMVPYTQKMVKSNFWYKGAINRLKFLQSTEAYLNQQLESGTKDKISVKEARDAIGLKTDDESPLDVMMGWWRTDDNPHPIDFGLGYLIDLMESHKFDPAGEINNVLDYVMVDDGHDCKRDWYIVFNPMGNLYNRK